jgi:hypothetical protein
MTNALHLQAQPDVPIACDMSTAQDKPDERLAEYGRLFQRALLRRERRDDAVVFSFRADHETRQTVEDLAHREAACCPFLDYRIETVGDELIWTIANPVTGDERASVDAGLDAVYALPDHAGSNFDGFVDQLADSGVHMVEVDDKRFEFRDSPPE